MQKNHDGMDGKNTMPAYRLSDEEYARILEFKRDLHMHSSWSADSPEDGQSGLKNSRRILMTSVVSQPAFVSPYRGRIQSLIGRCVKKKYAEMKPGDQAEA